MNCPNNLIIKITSKSKINISNIIVNVKILANEKNDYGLSPLLTNKIGEINISKTSIMEQISNHKKLFIMDYSSDLENCNQEIEIKINSLITLNNIANNLEKYYPEVAKEYKKTISISNNSKLTDFKIICKIIPIEGTIINVMID